MTPEQLRAEADQAAQEFFAAGIPDETSGIPKPPKIETTETSTDVEPFNFQFDRAEDKAQTFPGTGGGFFIGGTPPLGACCRPSLGCSLLTEEQCTTQGGTWHGANSTCTPNPCVDCQPDISVNLGPGSYTGCAATVDSASYGPYLVDMDVTFSGHVDDDVQVNGVIVQAGEFAFTDCEGCPCESSNGNNGEHNFNYEFTLPAGSTIDIQLLNWFSGSCLLNGTLQICPVSGRGTRVATIAKPIAKGLDAVLGTDFQNCAGCHKMEANLNAGMSWSDAIWDRFWPSSQPKEKNADDT